MMAPRVLGIFHNPLARIVCSRAFVVALVSRFYLNLVSSDCLLPSHLYILTELAKASQFEPQVFVLFPICFPRGHDACLDVPVRAHKTSAVIG